MARQNGVNDLRDHRVVVTDNAGKNCCPGAEFRSQVLAQLIFHAATAQEGFGKRTLAKVAKCARRTHEQNPREERLQSGLYAVSARARSRLLFAAHAPNAAD